MWKNNNFVTTPGNYFTYWNLLLQLPNLKFLSDDQWAFLRRKWHWLLYPKWAFLIRKKQFRQEGERQGCSGDRTKASCLQPQLSAPWRHENPLKQWRVWSKRSDCSYKSSLTRGWRLRRIMRCHLLSLVEIFNLSENSLFYHLTWNLNLVVKNNSKPVCKLQYSTITIIVDFSFSSRDCCFLLFILCNSLFLCPWHLALSHKV